MASQMPLPGFLADRVARDAGKKGIIKQSGLPGSSESRCSRCGTPLGRNNTCGELCLRCAWEGENGWGWNTDWRPTEADLSQFAFGTQPFAHQVAALRASQPHSAFAYLMEMGTGKTKVVIDDWVTRVRAGELTDLLVIAPAGVYRNWERELAIHLPEDEAARVTQATWISGMGVRRQRDLSYMLSLKDPRRPRVLLVNIEALSTVDRLIEACSQFLSRRRAMIVIDESTTIRTFNSKRTTACLTLATQAPVRRIATGLPTPRSPLDLFSQFEFLNWNILGFRSYYGFRNRYAVQREIMLSNLLEDGKVQKQKIIVGYRHISELRDRITDRSFRVLKRHCLDLPPKVYERWDVDLTPEQQRVYRELKQQYTSMIDSGAHVTVKSALTLLMRLQQVCLGYVVDEERVLRELDNRRIDQLMELLQSHDGKVIVWAPYLHSLRTIENRLIKHPDFGRGSFVRYWGEIGQSEKHEAIDRFQTDSRVRVFLGNQSAGGRGNTLTEANQVIYYANSWDLEHRLQSEDRPHRSGLKHSVTYIDMIAPGSIEERQIRALRDRMDMAAAVTGDGLREWLI